MCCSTMDPLHACARDGDLEGLAKLLDQDSSINVKGAFNPETHGSFSPVDKLVLNSY